MDFLGFDVEWEHRFEDGLPLYMHVSRSGFHLHLSEHHGDACPGGAVTIAVSDVDALARELAEKDYRYAKPGVEETPWRTRDLTVVDPFGNRLVFSQAIG